LNIAGKNLALRKQKATANLPGQGKKQQCGKQQWPKPADVAPAGKPWKPPAGVQDDVAVAS
jgi:hypothetical protein